MTIAPDVTPATAPGSRRATARHFLMCRPTHFEVTYSINPWMSMEEPVDTALAMRQWEGLRATYLELGHTVEVIEGLAGLPDMVFAANGATVVDGKVLGARFRNDQRVPEGPAYMEWFRRRGYTEIHDPEFVNEGEGDYLFAGSRILAGHGFRTDVRAHGEAQEFFGRPVISLRLVDPRYYHLDTALAVLGHDTVMYLPEAFSPGSRAVLEQLYPDAIIATPLDAEVFGLNAVSDGRHVIHSAEATGLAKQLAERGFEPIGVELGEFLKSGGSVKCCTLELRSR